MLPAHAKVISLDQLPAQHDGDKVRLVARTAAFDAQHATLLVHHADAGLLADVSLCLDPRAHAAFLRPKAIVMLVGRLERVAPAPAHVRVDAHLVLRAILARHIEESDFDLATWHMAIPARDAGASEE
ncbi:hypothetical protein AURDEDRAFT_159084 [Auricularia subglabra TFB-10046 SS5]|nr:hypothetical protein AURDEDRAFT_159084 [Auricularia subglabra TFB-10046 SS5]